MIKAKLSVVGGYFFFFTKGLVMKWLFTVLSLVTFSGVVQADVCEDFRAALAIAEDQLGQTFADLLKTEADVIHWANQERNGKLLLDYYTAELVKLRAAFYVDPKILRAAELKVQQHYDMWAGYTKKLNEARKRVEELSARMLSLVSLRSFLLNYLEENCLGTTPATGPEPDPNFP
jgi:hypothetical protein